MYKKPSKSLWTGRVDQEKSFFSKRWHEMIELLPEPYKKKAGIALLGFASDEGVRRNQGRRGASQGFTVLKKIMSHFAYHLKNHHLYDSGEVIGSTDLEQSQKVLASHIHQLLNQAHFPIIVGGGHEVAYSSFLALFHHLSQPQNIALLNFDAHFDIRDNPIATSGTPFSQIASFCKSNQIDFNYLCLGISKAANTQALFEKAKSWKIKYILDTAMTYKNFNEIKKQLDDYLEKKTYLYISIDSDVFSPYSVPGVSAPAGRGIGLDLVYNVLEYIFIHHSNKVKLVDFAEFNPLYDWANIGARSIARLIYDLVQLVDENKTLLSD